MILSGKKFSLQNTLNKFFSAIGEVFKVPTDSAYCQAKQKVKPEVFEHLTAKLSEDFYRLYGADDEVKLWRGHRLIGGDGTRIELAGYACFAGSFRSPKESTKRVCPSDGGGCL